LESKRTPPRHWLVEVELAEIDKLEPKKYKKTR
jgi:hypothetical protein